jgi:hypothetical protein
MPTPIEEPAPSAWECLTAILPVEQREQFANLLLEQLKIGWGGIEIEVHEYHIKLFRAIRTVPAKRPK